MDMAAENGESTHRTVDLSVNAMREQVKFITEKLLRTSCELEEKELELR
jgi:hypothetical protein